MASVRVYETFRALLPGDLFTDPQTGEQFVVADVTPHFNEAQKRVIYRITVEEGR